MYQGLCVSMGATVVLEEEAHSADGPCLVQGVACLN